MFALIFQSCRECAQNVGRIAIFVRKNIKKLCHQQPLKISPFPLLNFKTTSHSNQSHYMTDKSNITLINYFKTTVQPHHKSSSSFHFFLIKNSHCYSHRSLGVSRSETFDQLCNGSVVAALALVWGVAHNICISHRAEGKKRESHRLFCGTLHRTTSWAHPPQWLSPIC